MGIKKVEEMRTEMKTDLSKNRKIILKAVVAVILFCSIVTVLALSDGEDEKREIDIRAASADIDKKIDKVSLTDEEKAEIKEIESDMEEELAAAKTDEEKQQIKEKYAEKKSAVTKAKSTEAKKASSDKAGTSSDKKTTDKKQDSSANKKPSGQTDTSSKPAETTKPTETDEPEKVWVVDQEAYTYERPIYGGGYQGYWIRDFNGNFLLKTTDPDEFQRVKQQLRDSGNNSWKSGCNLPSEIIGYETVTVAEQGHWEYR